MSLAVKPSFKKWQSNSSLLKLLLVSWCLFETQQTANRVSQSVSQSVELLSHVWLFETLWMAGRQAALSITNSWSLPKLMSIELVMPSNHHPLPSPSAFNLSQHQVLHIRWPKYWSFGFNISPSNEHPGLVSFRMDWLDLLAVQGTLKV